MTATTDALDLVGRWAEAEQGNDAKALDTVLAGDFVRRRPPRVRPGPPAVAGRFANGLENRAFVVQDAQVRDYGDAAAVVGVLAQETSFQGRDNSGRFRLTLVAVQSPDRWRLANAHIGPLQQPPGPPPS